MGFTDCFRERDWWRDMTWGYWKREETLGGTPHGYTFFMPGLGGLARVCDWWKPED